MLYVKFIHIFITKYHSHKYESLHKKKEKKNKH